MKLRTASRITAAVLVVASLCAGAATIFLALWLRLTTHELVSSLNDVDTARSLQAALDDYRYEQLLGATEAEQRRVRDQLRAGIRQAVERIEADDPEEQRQLDRVTASVDAYIDLVVSLPPDLDPYQTLVATAQVHREARQAVGALLDTQILDESEVETRVSDRAGTAFVVALLLGVLLPLTVAIAILLTSRQLLVPLRHLRDAMVGFMSGDFGKRAPVAGPDETEDVATRFNDLADALVAQARQRSVSITAVAHDLRNPLATLRMTTSILARTDLSVGPERLHRHLEVVARQVERLERMVTDLIDVSRLESGELRLNVDTHDVVKLARGVVELFAQASRQHRVVLDAPDQPVLIECDDGRLEQVLVNLVSNAIKYSPAGGEVKLTVTASAESVVLAVEDEGVGIAPEELRQIFQPFRRIELTASVVPGVGLGLSVVRKLVTLHHGDIEIDSRVGEGSTFRVTLPRRQPARKAVLRGLEPASDTGASPPA